MKETKLRAAALSLLACCSGAARDEARDDPSHRNAGPRSETRASAARELVDERALGPGAGARAGPRRAADRRAPTRAAEAPGSSQAPRAPNPWSCPAPPASATSEAIEAWSSLNAVRLAAGAGCMRSVPALNDSALAHCSYYASNKAHPSCVTDPHGERLPCAGFTGDSVMAREIAAGYPPSWAYTEVMTFFGGRPREAVPSWIDTVWHRIPLLDPWTTDMGYGAARGCDVIDLGRGSAPLAPETVVVYPYPDQTEVPPSFSGLERPAPPAPPRGFPSSYPISIYAQQLRVDEHSLTRDGEDTPIEHLWLDARSPEVAPGYRGYLTHTAFMYGAPFEPDTRYRVAISGSHADGALALSWTFTTAGSEPAPQSAARAALSAAGASLAVAPRAESSATDRARRAPE